MRFKTLLLLLPGIFSIACFGSEPAPDRPIAEPLSEESSEFPEGDAVPSDAPQTADAPSTPPPIGSSDAKPPSSSSRGEDGPIPVGPGVEPPRRIQRSSYSNRLNDLLASGRYSWGVCIFTVTVSATGRVEDVRVLKPEDIAPEVRSAIVETAEQWRFEPATQDGRPISVYYNFSVSHCPLFPQEPQDPER